MMDRRAFIVGSVTALAAPLAAEAQQAKVPRIGYIGLVPPTSPEAARIWEAFLQGLREHGYVAERNLGVERRYLEGKDERAATFVTDLLQMNVDIIVTPNTLVARAAKQRTSTIPIVFIGVSDPVRDGLVASLARPGGNVTGISAQFGDVQAKALQILREALPGLSRLAVLWSPAHPASAVDWNEMQSIAKASDVALVSVEIQGPADLEPALGTISRERPDALYVHIALYPYRTRIMEHAAVLRLPVMGASRIWAPAGALVTYGPDYADMFRRAASHVAKILKGAKPADLPVEQPTRFEHVVNARTAKALGLTIPASWLLRADQVIE
jgi:putative ABC transport system substrate-binding protein